MGKLENSVYGNEKAWLDGQALTWIEQEEDKMDRGLI